MRLSTHHRPPVFATFLLGEIVISEAAYQALGRTPLDLIARHAVRDHGQITSRERVRNDRSYDSGGQIMSRYRIDPTNPRTKHVLIITRSGGDETVVCLESEAKFFDKPCSPSSSQP